MLVMPMSSPKITRMFGFLPSPRTFAATVAVCAAIATRGADFNPASPLDPDCPSASCSAGGMACVDAAENGMKPS